VGTAAQVEASRAAIDADLALRRRTQPLNLPNSGSVFRNPPGDHAARLLEACGLKGRRCGNAQVSLVHANFIVNQGGARAREILALMRAMQDAVQERFGVLLVPEVKLLGAFDPGEVPRAAPEPAAAAPPGPRPTG
jgi:UDP-N-acetylmuramate dehydrogenase